MFIYRLLDRAQVTEEEEKAEDNEEDNDLLKAFKVRGNSTELRQNF